MTAAAVIIGAASGGRAEGGPGPLVLWDVPAECPGAADVLQRLRELAGPSALEAASQREVRGRIQYAASRLWVLDLELRDRHTPQAAVQRRRIEAPRCAELGEAAAVALAISLSAEEPLGAEVPAEASSASPLTPAQPEPRSSLAPSRASAADANDTDAARERAALIRSSGASAAFGVSGLVDFASLGGAALGVSVDAELELGAVGVAARGVWLPSRHWAVGGDGAPPAYVDFSLLGGGASGCYHSAWGLGKLAGCAGFELGVLRAAAHGFAAAGAAQDLWLAPSLDGSFAWSVGPHLMLASRVGTVFPLGQDNYEVDAGSLVQHTPRVVLRLFIGVQSRWGAP